MPRVTGWSDDEFDDRAQNLAALIRRVWRAIARLIAAQAEQQSQVTLAVAKPIVPQWQQAVDGQIIGFVRNMYLDAAGDISDALNAPDELLIGDDLVEVYTNAARNRLVGIGDDVWKNVQAQIALGNQSGESIPEIATRIRNVAGVSEGRSLTIARTEVHAAHEAGSYEQAVFVDPNAEKTWLATADARTRPSHRAVDGQTVKIGESFNVGGSKLRYPGDPLGAPEDCINCRCSVAYNFDMITTVIDEPEPAMVAAGGQTWKAHNHPRGADGKFIEKGAVSDFLKKAKPNIIDVTKAVGNLDAAQWGKLTDAQKTHIKDSVDKLPKGTATHDGAKKTLDSLEKSAAATAFEASPKPKTKMGEIYDKLADAKDGDVLATGTKYNSAGVPQKFKITADKSHVHPDYMPKGKLKLEFIKKNGEPGQATTGGPFTINQKLHPLPAKGKKPSKVEWDDDAPQADAPQAAPAAVPDVAQAPQAPAGPTKIPAGLKGNPGDPAKITTGVVWGKHQPGDVILEGSPDFSDLRVVWNGKKYEVQSLNDIGDWEKQYDLTKKDFYANHKDDTSWVIPGGEKTSPPPFAPDADLLEQTYNSDGDDTPSQQLSPEAAGYDPTPDEVDWNLEQWQRENTGKATPEPPSTPQSQAATVAPKLPAPDPSKLTDTGQVLGSHGARVFKDDQDNSWLFKAQDKFATNMDIGASELQNRAGRPSPETYAISLNGKSGSIQRMLDGTGDFGHPNYFDAAKLTPAQRREVLREQPVDWLISNFDAHSENFINMPNGQVLAIDKGNGLKFFGQDSLTDYNWRPNEHRTVYSHLWQDYAAGKFDITSDDLKAISESINKLQAISDDDLKEMFRPYAEEVNKKGWLLTAKSNHWAENLKPHTVKPNDVEAFLDALVARKKALKADFESLYVKATTDRNDSPDIEKKSVLTPELASDVGFTEVDAGSYGGVHDKGVLLNDLESGAILPLDQAIDLGLMLNESDYNDLSLTEKTQLQTSLSVAADMDILGAKESYAHWQTLHNQPDDDFSDLPDLADLEDVDDEDPYEDIGLDGPGDYATAQAMGIAKPITTDEPDTSKVATSAGGALHYLDEDEQTKMVSSDGKFVLEKLDHSPMGTYSLETKQDNGSSVVAYINNADDVEYVTEQIASLWYPAKVADDTPPVSTPMISGASLSLKDLHNLIVVNGKVAGKYADGQVVATSPDGKYQVRRSKAHGGYALHDVEANTDTSISNIHAIKKIRDDDFRVPEGLLLNHSGQLVEDTPMAEEPSQGDPVVDADTIGITNSGALQALDNGDAEILSTLDGKYEVYKSASGEWTTLKENHPDDTATINLIDTPEEIDGLVGLQVWYPKQEIDGSTNSTDATVGVSNKPIDLSVIQEDIDLNKYSAGETIGITEDGQHKLTYSAFLNGVMYQTKVGNTGDDDLDWDSLATYSDDSGSPVDDFLSDYPDVKLFEPQNPNTTTTDDSRSIDWDAMLSGPYAYNDVVAQVKDGKFQLVHKGTGSYQVYAKADGGNVYSSTGSHYHNDITDGDLTVYTEEWQKVSPGTQFKSGKTPVKKAAKAAGVPKPGAYSPAVVTPGEKKFYLEDAEWGSLVAVEAVHLLNGAGGLDVHEASNLTPTQTGNINTQLAKALDNNLPGSAAAWQKWAGLEQQINGGNTGYDASKIADHWYFINVENDMWAGNKSTGDVFAITPDGKYRLVIHSTEGPFENPNSFALEQHGPLGWELNKIYTGYGGPPAELAADTDTMSKTWLKSDGADTTIPAASPVSFDPPGTGTQLASTIFNMLNWVPEGKTLLVGKDDNGDKFKMVAGKSPSGAKVINVDLWYPNSGEFKGWAQFHNEDEYNNYVDDPIKWDTPGTLSDTSALPDFTGNLNSPVTPPTAPTSNTSPAPVLDSGSKLTQDHTEAFWAAVQNLDEDTVVATGTAKNGNDLQMVVKKHAEGHSILSVQKKHPVSDKWGWWYTLTDEGQLVGDLDEESWYNVIDVPGVPDANALPSGASAPKPADLDFTSSTENATKIWAAIQNMPDGTELATAENAAGFKKKMVVQTSPNTGTKYIDVQAWDSNTGTWEDYSAIGSVPMLSTSLMQTWDPIGAPSASTPTPTPTAPTVSTPAAPKPVPLYKINILKSNMKADGNIGYWSKPENIWAQIKKFQKLPGNENISPMDFFTALDSTLKTDKHSYVAKMTKWAASNKGAQIIGQDGIYGSAPNAPATVTPPKAKAVLPDIEAGNDISGFDDAKQKSIYDTFKAHPYTYLSSPEHAIFDAMQDVAKAQGLTLAQIINIVDEQGAKKVSKPNESLFKKKLSAWLKTPDAAAHILNEPTVVTGLAKPPAYHPQYDPDKNPGQIPSFEESSKLTYDYVASNAAATKIWSDIVAKTSDFSPAEKKALTVWTGGAYTTINGHLVNPNPSPLSSTHKSAMTGSQLGMRPSDRPMVLVRGTGFTGLGNAKNHAQLEKLVGTTWRNNGFAATSVGRAGHDDPGVHSPAFSSLPLWIEFEAPPGTPMAWVTPFSSVGTGEREMLLGANLHYKILSVEKKTIPGYGVKTIARVRIVPKPEGAAE